MKRFFLQALLLVIFIPLFMAGCAATRPTNHQLLTTDYSGMTDQELLEYYRQLEDRIAGREAAGGGMGFGLGLGFGFGFDGGAVGLGASKGVGGDAPAEALQPRRNDVRLELARRGLEPLPMEEQGRR
jgi:hypothetical protein